MEKRRLLAIALAALAIIVVAAAVATAKDRQKHRELDLAEVYRIALDSLMPLDEGLNHNMKFIAINTETMEGLADGDKAWVLGYFRKYGVLVMDASLEELKQQGLFNEEGAYLDGILLSIDKIEAKSPHEVIIEGSKYRSGTGAIGVVSTIIYKDQKWQLKEAKIVWIS